MAQMMVIIVARHVPLLMRSLRAKGISVTYLGEANEGEPSSKVKLFVTMPDSRIRETYDTLASIG